MFQLYKNYKNPPRNARVVDENNVASFFQTGVLESHTENRKKLELNLVAEHFSSNF